MTTFFNVSAASIVSKFRGESEKLIKILFDLAKKNAPSTIFIDEIDSIMSHRGNSEQQTEHEGSRRMKTELLIQMDGLEKENDKVFVLCATNLPWELDSAFLRRLEKKIFIGLPSKNDRKLIFEKYLEGKLNKIDPTIAPKSDSSLMFKNCVDLKSIVSKSEGYSGSDIRLVCKEAAMRPVRRFLENLESDSIKSEEIINIENVLGDDLEIALEKTPLILNQNSKKYFEFEGKY